MSRGLTPVGELFIVATPIGNLADMVPRAVEILQNVDFIAAEDTRHSGKLMQHFQINTPLVAYHDYTDEARVTQLLKRLQAGERMALISDAGTPLISDPGYRLVHWARQAGIRVTPVPGACAKGCARTKSTQFRERAISSIVRGTASRSGSSQATATVALGTSRSTMSITSR